MTSQHPLASHLLISHMCFFEEKKQHFEANNHSSFPSPYKWLNKHFKTGVPTCQARSGHCDEHRSGIWTWIELLEIFSSVWFRVVFYIRGETAAPLITVSWIRYVSPANIIIYYSFWLWTKKHLWEECALTEANKTLGMLVLFNEKN